MEDHMDLSLRPGPETDEEQVYVPTSGRRRYMTGAKSG
jgi:hypothetical protein